MHPPRILGICGSLRAGSRTLKALEIALQGAAHGGALTETLDLRKLSLPFYDDRKETDTYPAAVFTLIEKVRQADGLILASPVYHGILSGTMKNALDFLELSSSEARPWLENKVVGLISVAGGDHGTNTLNSMLHTVRAMRAWVSPISVAIPGSAFASDGELQNAKIKERLARLGADLAKYAQIFAQQRATRP